VVSDVPTAYHLLAVSWSPQACRSGADYPDAEHQCRDNRFGLTLHGLWPNGAPGARYPRYCRPELAARPVPASTVREHFCMTPSPELQQHEWAAHGTCGWTSPEAYFADAARLWNALNRPDLEAIPADRLTAGAIRRAFAQANPGLTERSVVISTADGWFREARICHDLDYRPISCPIPLGPPDDAPLRLAPRGPVATGR
jgi:ribonuclease T2